MRVSKACLFGALVVGVLACQPRPAFSQQAGSQQILCGRSLQFSLGATAITQIVAGSVGMAVHVCGLVLNTGAAAATYQLTTGSGTNCGTNTLNLTPAWAIPANSSFIDRNIFTWYSSPLGNSLCHTVTGTGPVNGLLLYHQF